jgi:hypothetical protein
MSTDRDVTRIVRSWLEDGATALPDRVLDSVLDQLPATPQRRSWWPARRLTGMNTTVRLALAAAAVLVVAVVGFNVLPGGGGIGGFGPTPSSSPSPTPPPTPTPSPMAIHSGALAAGTYVMTPFAGPNAEGMCMPQATGCAESPADDSIRVTLTVPDGFEAPTRPSLALIFGPGGETGLVVLRGGRLYGDPCHTTPPPDIAVGPTVADFVDALVRHPDLDVTAPADVTLAGYEGKYVDLQLPADTSECTPSGQFWPFEPGMYAQGPSHRWHLYILDVEGTRVVIQVMDYARTSAEDLAKLQSIVDSIKIEP